MGYSSYYWRWNSIIIAILSINCSRLIFDIRQQFYARRSQYQASTKRKTAGVRVSVPIELTRLDSISADERDGIVFHDSCQSEVQVLDQILPGTLSTVVEED